MRKYVIMQIAMAIALGSGMNTAYAGGGSSNGHGNNGGSSNGGSSTCGNSNGGSTTGGSTTGGSTTGGSTTGGSTTGGSTTGGSTTGGSTTGGSTTGGSTTGGSTTGGSTTGGSTTGGSTTGGSTTGGSTTGGTTTGGSTTGGSTTGGESTGGTNGGETPPPKVHRQLIHRMQPAFYLDFDYGTNIINLAGGEASPAPSPVALSSVDYNVSNDSLVYGDFQSGFQVVNYSNNEGGLGLKQTFYYANATGLANQLWLSIGLTPMKGKEIVSVSYANTLSEAHAMVKRRFIPQDANAVRSMSVGDTVTYTAKGGTIFYANFGVSLVGLGSVRVAEGQFQTYVEKMSEDEVLVRLTDVKVANYSTQAQSVLVSAGGSRFREEAKGLSFLINYRTETGAKAYWDAIRGNVAAVQKLAADSRTTGVYKFDKISRQQVGQFRHYFFGLPIILNTTWASGNVYSLSNTQTVSDLMTAKTEYNVYLKEKHSRIFRTHTNRSEAFYGAVYSLTDKKNVTVERSLFGQYVWTADNDDTSARELRNAISDLKRKTGLRMIDVAIPNKRNLEYSKVRLTVTFNAEKTKAMIATALRMRAPELERFATAKLKAVRSEDAVQELCPPSQRNDNCMRSLEFSVRHGATEMYKASIQMNAALNSKNEKAFVKAYADFGKAMLRNQFTFELAMDLAGAGVDVEYSLNGTMFSQYELDLSSTNQSGEYIPADGRSLDSAFDPESADSAHERGMIFGPGKGKVYVPGQNQASH